MTKKIDYEGALKVYDAIEGIPGSKPRLILVSAVDIRDPNKIPEHYVSAPSFIHRLLMKCTCDTRTMPIKPCPIGYAKSFRITCAGNMRQTRSS